MCAVRAIVLAGRRYRQDVSVRAALRPWLEQHRRATLVCSAAAGADLVALDLARELGMTFRVVLPSDRDEFRKGSVIDRGERWGKLFDELVGPRNAIAVDAGKADPYVAANDAILAEGLRIAHDAQEVLALVVWNGKRERNDKREAVFDYTEDFRGKAADCGFHVEEILVPE